MKTPHQKNRLERAAEVFIKHGGILRTGEAIRAGIHPDTLYSMRDNGILEKVSRGVFRIMDSVPLSNPDLVSVAKRIPKGVICLISALSFHDITTQIPHEIYVALARGADEPRLKYPPIRTFRFSRESFEEGIEIHIIDNVPIKVYSLEKTLADCFKFRNKIGLDTCIEALKLYRERHSVKVDILMQFASACRVEKVIRPYLEALL